MDLFDIVRADGGSIAPVIIFIIWVLFSIIGNSQKQKKKRMLAEQQRREEEERQQARRQEAEEMPYEQPSEPEIPVAAEHEYSRDGDIVDIERELESVFGTPAETDGEPGATSIETSAETPPSGEAEPFTYDSATVPASSSMESATAADEPFSAFSSTSIERSALQDGIALAEAQPVSLPVNIASVDDVRQGVVWSEILGPCKALREP